MTENTIKKTILLVEDEIMAASAQKTALEKFAYKVITSETGESAVSVFRTMPGIDLVLMDIDLGPGIDGAEAARQILAERNVPIVFLTNHTESDFLKKTESVISYGYMVKNSKTAVLDTSIKMAFRLFEADKKVHEAFAELNHSQAIAHVCSWRLDLAAHRFSSSEEGLRIFGFPPGAEPGFEEVMNCVVPEDRQEVRERMVRAVDAGQAYRAEMQIRKKDTGEKRFLVTDVEIERGPKGIPAALMGTTQDITERKHAESVSLRNLRFMEALLDSIPAAVFYKDTEGKYLGCNNTFSKIMGVSSEEIKGKTVMDLWPGDLAETYHRKDLELISNPAHQIYDSQVVTRNGKTLDVVFAKDVFYDDTDRIAGIVGAFSDITERKRAEDSLKESEERYKRITAGLNDYLYTVKVSGGKPVETIHNEACSSITGYSIHDFACDPYLWINMVVPEEREMVAGRFAKILEGNDLPTFEHRIIRKDGTLRWISDTCIPKYDESGVLVSYDGVIKDITARKQAEEKIKALLIEKELILKEVHHRIKNNMNTINSLLNLQAGSLKDPAAITALEDAGRRVRSMMMLYDKLYRSEFFSEMSILQYLPSLVDEILVNFPNSRSVTVEKHIEDFELDVKKLQSIGIIVNELLTNIMKYAFKGKKDGKIIISAYLKNGTVSLTIEDNGLGMPESVDFEHSTGFGLMLVGVLTKQLRGELRIGRENGTKISMEFLR